VTAPNQPGPTHPDFDAVVSAFVQALQDRGIDAKHSDIIADGRIHRLGTNEKPRSKNGAYLLHFDAFPAGYIENLSDGLGKQTWSYGRPVAVDRAALEAHIAETKRAQSRRAADRKMEAESATASAKARWEAATEANPDHPYLVRKGVGVHGLRQSGDALLAPMRNAKRDLVGIQTILPEKVDGKDKLYTRHVSTTGLYYSIGRPDPSDPIVCVCEGVATGHSIAECTGYSVAVAFDCHNLEPVTQAIRVAMPTARIVVCCDDDWKQKLKNPGRVKGEAAAGAWGGTAVWPVWPEGYARRGSDFNDLHVTLGKDAVRTQIARALVPTRAPEAPKPVESAAPTEPAVPGSDAAGTLFGDYHIAKGHEGQPARILRTVCKSNGDERVIEVCCPPVHVAAIAVDVDSGEHFTTLTWQTTAGPHTLELSQEVTHASRLLVGAAKFGLPVSSTTAADLVDYLVEAERHHAAAAGVTRTTRRTGWHGASFLRGTHPHGATAPALRSADIGVSQYMKHVREAGTLAGWIAAVAPAIEKAEPLRLMVAAAAVSPMLAIFGDELDSFVVDAVSLTSHGKTMAHRVCASVWGDPERLLQSWNITPVALDRMAGGANGLPMLLNESQRGPRSKPDVFAQMLYDITARVGKVRGSVNGTQRCERYESITLSNGENSLAEITADGGLRARVLTLWGSPWGGVGDAFRLLAERTQAGVFEHHGHAGCGCFSVTPTGRWCSR